MGSSINSQANFGSFVATTNIWEIQQIQSSNIDPKLKEILVRLYQNINNISLVLNSKDSAIYDTQEFLTGQMFFPLAARTQSGSTSLPYRPIFRTVINFGPLPNNSIKNIPHNITINSGYIFTRIYGAASQANGQSSIPIPYASNAANNSVEIEVTNTNVSITTTSDFSSYTTCYVILEYIKA